MIRRLALAVLLILVWVFLWGSASPANLLSGAAIVAVLFVAYPIEADVGPKTVRLVPLLRLAASFLGSVVVANVLVSAAVFSPHRAIRQGVIKVAMHTDDPAIITLVTNFTALTPGSVVVHIDDHGPNPVLWLHVLALQDPFVIARAAQRLERQCVMAFGTDEQVAMFTGSGGTGNGGA